MKINIFLQDNLKALGQYCPKTAAWLAGQNPDVDELYDRLFVNCMGLLDWRMGDGESLFAKVPPKAIYNNWRPEKPAEGGATVIIGAGLGYGVNHVLTGVPKSHKVVVIEPHPKMLMACLGQTDYRPFMEVGMLRFLPPDPKTIELHFRELDVSFLFSRINLRPDLACKQIGPEYERLAVLARHKLESLAIELSTLRHKQEVMVGNELKNFSRAMNDGALLPMENMAKGLTAVVLGAGPSLTKIAPMLKENQGNALYLSALQTLPTLELLGFKPDLCLGIDFNPEMADCVKRMKDMAWAADIPLIYSTKMDPAVLEAYPGPTIPLWTLGGVATFMMAQRELVLDAGGNVGVTIERLMTWCGASAIVLAGQDFAWSGDQSHATGHHYAEQRFTFDPKRDVQLQDADGRTIYSNKGFLSAKRDMEQDISKTSIPFYNLYGGGAVIAGAVNIDVKKAYAEGILSSAPGSKAAFLDALRRANTPVKRPVFDSRAREWSASLRNAQKRMEKLFKKLDKNQNEIRNMLGNVSIFLKQNPLYLPYLYNEVMDITGLVYAHAKYELKDLGAFKQIKKRVLNKVREVDVRLGANGADSSGMAA